MKKKLILLFVAALILGLFGCTSKSVKSDLVGELRFSGTSIERYIDNISSGEFANLDGAKSNEPVWFDNLNSMFLALDSGKINKILVPSLTAKYIVKNNEKYKMIDTNFKSLIPFCLMLRSDNVDLRDKLNSAYREIVKNEEEKELMKNLYVDKEVEFMHFDGAPTIKFAVTGDLPPMDYIKANEKPSGFSIALISLLCKKMKVNAELIKINSGDRSTVLSSGDADVVYWGKGQINDEYIGIARDFLKRTDKEKNEIDGLLSLFNDDGSVNETLIKEANAMNELDQPEGTIMTLPYFVDYLTLITIGE